MLINLTKVVFDTYLSWHTRAYMLFEREDVDTGGVTLPAAAAAPAIRTLSPRALDSSTLVAPETSSSAAEGGALPIGRTLESQRARQAVYIGCRTEGFNTDEAPGDIMIPQKLGGALVTSSGTVIQQLLKHNTHRNHFKDCDTSDIVKPPTAATYLESWSRAAATAAQGAAVSGSGFPTGKVSPETVALTPSIRGGPKPISLSKSLLLGASQSLAAPLTPTAASSGRRSPGRLSISGTLSPTVKSPSGRPTFIPHDLALNCLDEKQAPSTSELWWNASADISDEFLQDVPPDLFMEIHYPQQGFYVKMKDADCARYSWNEKFQAAFNVGETADRRIGMAEFVRDFSVEAIPFAMEVLGNLSQIPSPVVHKNGVTVEIPWLMPSVKYMFDDEGTDGFVKGMKSVNLEFSGRHFATMGACPQLNIPFTMMVEYIGVKALVYPRLPLSNGGFPAPKLNCGSKDDTLPGNRELVYGVERPEWFHAEPLMQHDSEVNAVVQRLAMLTKCKGCWLGKEFNNKRYIHGPVDMKVFRSDLDNRIYATNLARLCPTNTLASDAATEDDDSKEETSSSASGLGATAIPRRSNDYLMHRFRPEFIQKHLRMDLSSESTSPIAKINTEKDESERLQYVDMLMHYVIPQAAEQLARDVRLNGVTWPFIARGGLSNLLHSWGVNMRYLVMVHQKLIRTKLSGKAVKYVEIEIVARALKHWALRSSREHSGSGEVREYGLSDALSSCLVPFTEDFWQSVVWPAITHKYAYFRRKTVQKWDATRVEHAKVVQRLLRMVGAVVVLHETDAICDRWDWIKSPADVQQQVRINYFPVVKCPTYPRAPLEEGQDVHLMILAKRYLREVTVDLKYNPVSNKDMLERYIAFLEQMGERHCEEVAGFYIAEQERKDRVLKGAKPSSYAEAGKDERTIKYRLKGNRGMRVLEVAREALDRFKFYQNQKVQQTLGGDAGQISTIIGVIDGVLYHHEEGADGATELFGRNFNELQGNYGLVLLDKLMYLKRTQAMANSQNYNGGAASGTFSSSPLANVSPSDVALKQPYHQVGDRGLLIFESLSEILFDAFSVESGQRFMYLRGPKRGSVTTVIGMMDGSLWHLADGATQYEVMRVPSATSSDHLSDDGRGGMSLTSIDTKQAQRFMAFRHSDAVTMARSKLFYPIDPAVVYEDSLDIFAGYRSCVAFGFFYRQIVQFQKGPYADMRGVILGGLSGNLQCLLPFRHVPVALGSAQADIVEAHAPQVVGVLSYSPTHEPLPQLIHYPGLGGDVLRFDASYAACLPLGGVRGQRVKVVLGGLAGLCGFVVGCRSGKLWAQLDGESGAQPLVPGAFIVLRGSMFVPDRSIEVPVESVSEAQFLSVFPSREPTLPVKATSSAAHHNDPASMDIIVRYLTEFGEVVAFDASPIACDSFGYYHSQRLRLQRVPRKSLSEDLTADVLFVVVVGVFHGELFYVVEGEPYARPFVARSRWQLDWMYAPDVVGLSPITNFSDMFCSDSNRLQWSGVDAFHEDARVQLVYCVATDTVIGLDTLGVTTLHSTWRCGTTIIRQDRVVSETLPNGSVIHRPDGPQATVWGTYNAQLYIEFRDSYTTSIGRANATSTLRRVEVLPLKECPKWLQCAGWQHQVRKTFLSPEEIKKSDSYDSRIGLETQDTPIFTHWWCYLVRSDAAVDGHDGSFLHQQTSLDISAVNAGQPTSPSHSTRGPAAPPQLVLFSRDVSQCLEKLYEVNGGKRGSHYDVDGGAYYIESMSYIVKNVLENTKVAYDMVREPLETINSHVLYTYRVDVKAHFPEIHDALLARVCARIQRHPGMEVRHVAMRRQKDIAFARDEIQLMHDVCDIFPTMLHSALEAVGRSLPPNIHHEVELRYAYVPAPLRVPFLRWVLALLGVTCSAATTLTSLYALLVSMENRTNIITDVPTMEEFDMHVREQMSAVTEFEATSRLALFQEERNEWLRRMPRMITLPRKSKRANKRRGATVEDSIPTALLQGVQHALEAPTPFEDVDAYDGMSLRVTKSCLSIANEKFAALMTHKTAHNVACAKRLPLVHRFALQDGTALLLKPSCMTFQRGDVVEYTLGDIQGLRATIVGMFAGHLWRFEHTGVYRNLVMPFAGNETDIQSRYGLKVVRRENAAQVRLAPPQSLKLKESNMVTFLCYDGALRELDPSHHAVSRYGVLAGDRYTTTDGTNLELFPFDGLVVLIVGVCSNGLLWFTVDQTGAMPFKNLGPEVVPTCVNIAEHFSLRRAYHAPFRQAPFEQSKLIACLGVVGPEEGAVSGTIGPMTLGFLAAPEALKAHFNVVSGAKIAITSGDNKGRRLSVVGMRHGKLWVIWEYEGAARPLRSGLHGFDTKLLSSDSSGGFRSPESTTQLNLNNLLAASSATPTGSWLRFPTQRGGLALFQTDCYEAYHVESGQQVMYSVARKGSAALPKKKAIIVGIRDGGLWKVDEFESDAKPFIGVLDVAALHKKFDITMGPMVGVESETW